MTAQFFDLAARFKDKASISPEDTIALRRVAWPDGLIDESEAEAIFDLNTSIVNTSADWVDFFVEAISTYIVRQQPPVGYVDDAKCSWLMAKIDADGRIDTRAELELLVKVLEDATNVAQTLKSYALRQIETIVLTGEGPTRNGGLVDPGSINTTETTLLRRLLFAQSGDGPGIVSRSEADLLFRLKDATLGKVNAPEWQTLFVQGVGNHLMAHGDYTPLDRQEAARLDAFMQDTHVSIGGMLGKIGAAALAGKLMRAFDRAPVVDHDAAVAASRALTADELAWLKSSIARDEQLDPLEKALLAFVAEESGTMVSL